MMRWSEFSAKECIDLVNGEKIGSLSHSDCSFDPGSGRIDSIYVPIQTSWFRKKNQEIKVHWRMIKKIGSEMVIVESRPKGK